MAKESKITIEPHKMRGSVDHSSVSETDRTVDLIWTTGHKGNRYDIFGRLFYEELAVDKKSCDLTRLLSGAPLLAVHDSNSLEAVIGVVESASIDEGLNQGRAKVRFAKDEISEVIFQKVKDKILRNVSVGYSVSKYEDITVKDEPLTLRAVKWQPVEISIVPIGFDPGAQIRKQTNNQYEVEIEFQSEQKKENMSENENRDETKPTKKEIAAEKERHRQLSCLLGEKGGLSRSEFNDLIERDITFEVASKMVIARMAEYETAITTFNRNSELGYNSGPVSNRNDNHNLRMRGLEDAILHRIDPTNFKVTDASRPFYGQSLVQQFSGFVPKYSMESDATFVKRAMSSSDLPLALANIAEKSLQKQYDLMPRTFEPWTKKDFLRNYKPHSQVKGGDFSSLVERPEGAEFTYGSMGEANEIVQLKDYGKIHAFTSQSVINDDLGVIQRMVSSVGIAASRLETKEVYKALMTNKTMQDDVALYHGTHGNLGTAGAVGETTVAEAYKLMRKQMSTDGEDNLNLVPRFLICGPDKEIEARKFLSSIIPNQTSNVNVFQNSMEVIVDGQITGNQFYFVADPRLVDTVTCYRLEGQEGPKVSSKVDFSTSSLLFKTEYAFAAAPMDWRGLYKNAGN